MTQIYFDDQRQPLGLGKKIGTGGEGEVFEIVADPNSIAKIYYTPPDPVDERKLLAMRHLTDAELLQFCAWPQRLLRSGSSTGPVVGFVMRYFRDAVRLSDLLTHSDRTHHFPHLNWKDLVQLAENVAKAVAAAHARSLVIGDLHPKNILVNKIGMPLLIDNDSWQIPHSKGVFRRLVLTEDYTAPELQGLDYSKIDGTANHDAFALAQMIFLCLFPGQNPFNGQYAGAGPNDILTAIKEHRYIYAQNARRKQIKPPEKSLNPQELTPRMATLFEQAFENEKKRPTAEQWQLALRDFRRQLVPCSSNSRHYHQKSQRKCRWCEFENTHHELTFPNLTPDAIIQSNNSWTPPPALSQVVQLIVPNVTFPITPASTGLPLPPFSAEVQKSLTLEKRLTQLFLVGFLFSLASVFIDFIPRIVILFTLILFVVLSGFTFFSTAHQEIWRLRRSVKSLNRSVRREEKTLQRSIKAGAGCVREVERGKSLAQKLDIAVQNYRRFHDTQRQRYVERAMRDWLDSHKISTANIPGLTQSAMADLAQHGITTAAHVMADKLDRIATLSPRQHTIVMHWRERLLASHQPAPYRPEQTSNMFAREFKFYQDRLAVEQPLTDSFNRVSAVANQFRTQTEQSVHQIHAMQAQADIAARQAEELRKRFQETFMTHSASPMVMLAIGVLSAPLTKVGLTQFEKYHAAQIVQNEIPAIQIPLLSEHMEEELAPVTTDRPSQGSRENSYVVTSSQKSAFASTSPAPTATATQSLAPVSTVSLSAASQQLTSGYSVPPVDDETKSLLDRYMKAIWLHQQGLHSDGYSEMSVANQEYGQKTMSKTFQMLEVLQVAVERFFETARSEIQQGIRERLKQ